MIASAPAIEPATFTLPVKMKLSTKVSILPVILQLTALTIERKWESRTRMNIGSSRSRRRHKISRPTGNELYQKSKRPGVAIRILGRHVSAGGRSFGSATMAILLIKRAATEEAFRVALGTFVGVDIDLVLRIVVECTVSRNRIVLILQDLAATTELWFRGSAYRQAQVILLRLWY
ncbi:hypothetical protein ABIF64_001008 [Bradyrhizobium japonicum]|uniref:Uncharacterized protein n=2 Tax=Bradyrhizobium barranii subsp. barranii TaxID=2823807 RepID=A0A9X9YD85_9BRAD|nr:MULTISPECIES: hypothetical protein [Bradyrhizobium]UEM17879.1 hypothetical protein J4G43_006490 [Bradyrhizobium barranii subsp. barranii]